MTPQSRPLSLLCDSHPSPYISVVIPAFNEAERILPTLNSIARYLYEQHYSWEIIVVDDGSTDNTVQIIQQHSTEISPNIRLETIAHAGKGWAVKHGMLASNGQHRFMCDADLAMPVSYIEDFLYHMEQGQDIVLGSRQIEGAQRYGESLGRHIRGRVFNWAVRAIAVRGFQDTQCGFKCFRGAIVNDLFKHQRTRGLGFDVEILFVAIKQGLQVLEIPIDWYHQDMSKVRPFVDNFAMLRDVVSVRFSDFLGRY